MPFLVPSLLHQQPTLKIKRRLSLTGTTPLKYSQKKFKVPDRFPQFPAQMAANHNKKVQKNPFSLMIFKTRSKRSKGGSSYNLTKYNLNKVCLFIATGKYIIS